MRRWIAVAILCLSSAAAVAQEDEAGKANRLIQEGKLIEALPLYEELVKAHPQGMIYAEHLAVCLSAKAEQATDPGEVKALRTRQRDMAKRAVELGDTEEFVKRMTKIDPNEPVTAPANAAEAMLKEAEKAFGSGDFDLALEKYTAAADADPTLYNAPLFAGDTAFRKKDLKAAAGFFARAIAIDPGRETAYRYWGDAILVLDNNPSAAKEKFLDAIVAEPYNKLAWVGITRWAHAENAAILAPKIERPQGPVVDPKKPNNITINLDPTATDDKKNPGGSAWMMYSIIRAGYRGDGFKKDFPNEKEYRHTLKEEDAALSLVATTVKEKEIKPGKLDESLRTLIDLSDAGMLDCWILVDGADNGIAQDYDSYRKDHRQLLHDYLAEYVVHGGPI